MDSDRHEVPIICRICSQPIGEADPNNPNVCRGCVERMVRVTFPRPACPVAGFLEQFAPQ